jgi:hypothetical protein
VSIIRAALCGVSLGAELFGSGGAVRQSAAAGRVNGAVKCKGRIEKPLRISDRKALRRPSISLTSVSLRRNVRDIGTSLCRFARPSNADDLSWRRERNSNGRSFWPVGYLPEREGFALSVSRKRDSAFTRLPFTFRRVAFRERDDFVARRTEGSNPSPPAGLSYTSEPQGCRRKVASLAAVCAWDGDPRRGGLATGLLERNAGRSKTRPCAPTASAPSAPTSRSNVMAIPCHQGVIRRLPRRSGPGPATGPIAREPDPSLTVGEVLIVIVLSSLALWWAIWMALSSLASVLLVVRQRRSAQDAERRRPDRLRITPAASGALANLRKDNQRRRRWSKFGLAGLSRPRLPLYSDD